MSNLAKNPISKHYMGMPCMLGEMVGRIVGESDEGSWGIENGERCYSIPLFSTPHGTVIKTGKFYLSEITEDGLKQLSIYENELKGEGDVLYAGKINDVEL